MPPREWPGEDVELTELIGWQWCHSEGPRGSERRGPPLSDGDWTLRNLPGLGLVRGGATALGPSGQPREAAAPGAAPWESRWTLYLIARGEGACRVVGVGPVGREGGGRGGHEMQGSGWWLQD